MKIGIDVRCLASGKRTGVEEYTIMLLEELFTLDQENSFVLFFNAYKNKTIDLSWTKKYSNVSVRYHKIPNKLLNLALWYLHWPKIDKMLGGVDVLFMPNVNFCAVSKKTKVVMTLHDLSFERYAETFSWKHRFWHFFINPKRLCERADRIITVSQATSDDLRESYAIRSSTQVSVIHNGVAHQTRDPLSAQKISRIQDRLCIPERYILYFGTVEPRKNIVSIIRAYEYVRETSADQRVSELKLVIAGNEGWKGSKISQLIATSKYAHDIIVTGAVSDEEKRYIFHHAAVFLYPSLYEGFGFPPLEASVANVPVITSHTSSLPELVGPHAIMIDPLRSDEIAQALHDLLSDDLLCKYITTGAKINTHEFTWASCAQKTKNVLTMAVE